MAAQLSCVQDVGVTRMSHTRSCLLRVRAFSSSVLYKPFTVANGLTSRPLSAIVHRKLCGRLDGFRVRASADAVETDVEEEAFERMEKSLDAVKAKFASVRTGRANPAMLDRIQVEYYGVPTPLKQIAGVSVPEATMLVIQPYDQSAMREIEKAIMNSDLGITPSNDGKIIRLKIPELTMERRKEMAKTVSKLGEDGKVAIRNVRRDAMKDIEKLEASEDAKKDLEDSIQKLTDDYVKQIDKLVKDKQAELTKV